MRVVADFALTVCKPLYWHDGAQYDRPINGGSAFVLRFPDRLVGVTANHVLDIFDEARERNPTGLVCQFSNGSIRPEKSVISRSHLRDIATFQISEADLRGSGATALDCTGQWPPIAPQRGDLIFAVGYPEVSHSRIKIGHYEFGAWGGHTVVDDLTDRSIVTVYDPTTALEGNWGTGKPPLGFNMSGCSGGLVLLCRVRNGLSLMSPVAIIQQGPRGVAEGELAGADTIHMRRIDCILPSGEILEDNGGWLPS